MKIQERFANAADFEFYFVECYEMLPAAKYSAITS
jgi:hypothetical protein